MHFWSQNVFHNFSKTKSIFRYPFWHTTKVTNVYIAATSRNKNKLVLLLHAHQICFHSNQSDLIKHVYSYRSYSGVNERVRARSSSRDAACTVTTPEDYTKFYIFLLVQFTFLYDFLYLNLIYAFFLVLFSLVLIYNLVMFIYIRNKY